MQLVIKALDQKKVSDFPQIYSPIGRMSLLCNLLGITAGMNLETEEVSMKTAFLHGDMEEDIYMEQPKGFAVRGKEHLVCKLKKSLYGCKQAPRQWYRTFDLFMVDHGYGKMTADPCVFMKTFADGEFVTLLLYMEDMLIFSWDAEKIHGMKGELRKSFAMKDLGPTKQILNI